MASQRHSYRVDDDVLLDAARSCVLAIGVGRTTLTEVARRAQVSRMTLYRRFPDVRSLIAALMTREFGGLLAEISATLTGLSARERLVTGLVTGVKALGTNPIMRAALDLEPELILPYVVQRLGSTQRLTEQFIADELKAGHHDGSIRPADVPTQARAVLLIVQSFVLSQRPATSDVDSDALLDELAKMLNGALA
ncbi:TetR/AcrR family transcriptional regulator [Kibdelosporangium philippinense]|uniref:TetR/AcrR family transcriptional regulator n=1 Tax=Kibdelosporangium philippinense TaxID=211113 RepID=A0ABS8ZR89_9PSEU|nr:TetR/AcrR family transcriptional regulator [Kibdelosporangium philippinense]MCE7008973.1 TetR/AcrR family transcriptional regulator [Kibdelosporangium philippinense]